MDVIMKKAYVISINNGESYEENQILPVYVTSAKTTAEKWIKKNPVTIEHYRAAFHCSIPSWVTPRWEIDEVNVI
jgi:hypothetical protein